MEEGGDSSDPEQAQNLGYRPVKPSMKNDPKIKNLGKPDRKDLTVTVSKDN